MDMKKFVQKLVLGNDREKAVPTSIRAKIWNCIRYNYAVLLGLNLLFIVSCLPVITIPSAYCALNAVLTRYCRSEVFSVWSVYFAEYKSQILQRFLIWTLLMIAPLSIAWYCAAFGIGRDGTVIRFLGYTVVFLIQSYWFVTLPLIGVKLLQNLKNAIILMAVLWKQSLSILATAGVLYAACIFFPLYMLPLIIICLFSLTQVIICFVLTDPIIEKLSK